MDQDHPQFLVHPTQNSLTICVDVINAVAKKVKLLLQCQNPTCAMVG